MIFEKDLDNIYQMRTKSSQIIINFAVSSEIIQKKLGEH